MNLIDTHCHLNKEYYDDIDKIVENAKKAGINKMIVSSCSKENFEENLELARNYKGTIYLTISYHPEYASEIEEDDLMYLEKIYEENKDLIVGIGEIGLDYHYEPYSKEDQEKLFRSQIKLAKKLDLPIVVHTRDAWRDTLDILSEYDIKGVIHCFSGSFEVGKELIDKGFYIGIGGVVTFNNSKLKDTVKKLGLDNILLETDSPYLSPDRGKRNEPANVLKIAEFLSNYLETPIENIEKITNNNVKTVFNIDI